MLDADKLEVRIRDGARAPADGHRKLSRQNLIRIGVSQVYLISALSMIMRLAQHNMEPLWHCGSIGRKSP